MLFADSGGAGASGRGEGQQHQNPHPSHKTRKDGAPLSFASATKSMRSWMRSGELRPCGITRLRIFFMRGCGRFLGKHVKQAGSLVAPDHLRFDFSHFTAVEDEELQDIEDLINKELLRNLKVETLDRCADR